MSYQSFLRAWNLIDQEAWIVRKCFRIGLWFFNRRSDRERARIRQIIITAFIQ